MYSTNSICTDSWCTSINGCGFSSSDIPIYPKHIEILGNSWKSLAKKLQKPMSTRKPAWPHLIPVSYPWPPYDDFEQVNKKQTTPGWSGILCLTYTLSLVSCEGFKQSLALFQQKMIQQDSTGAKAMENWRVWKKDQRKILLKETVYCMLRSLRVLFGVLVTVQCLLSATSCGCCDALMASVLRKWYWNAIFVFKKLKPNCNSNWYLIPCLLYSSRAEI